MQKFIPPAQKTLKKEKVGKIAESFLNNRKH